MVKLPQPTLVVSSCSFIECADVTIGGHRQESARPPDACEVPQIRVNYPLRRKRLVLALLSAFATGVVACSGANRATPEARGGHGGVVVTVDVTHPGTALPTDFLGLSFEASVLGSDLFDPARSNLPALLGDLGTGRLRFGGNSVDRVAAWTADPAAPLPPWAHSRVTPADLAWLGRLAAETGWKVDLGLTLGHPDPAAAADEAAAAGRLIGTGLGTVQVGNEPDLLGNLRPGYTEAAYRADVAAYRASIASVAPGTTMSGPDTALPARLASYGADEGAGAVFLTQHFYPLTRCDGRRPTIAQLLSASTLDTEARLAATTVAAGQAVGLPVRLDETNSASCGGQNGVSNTLASALWVIEYLVTLAQHGVSGVGIQGGLAACQGYTPVCVPGANAAAPGTAPGIDAVADATLGAAVSLDGRLAAQPDFYGLLLVHQLEGGQWLPCRTNPPTPTWLAAMKMPTGAVRVVMVNPLPSAAAAITVRAPGRGDRASLQLLTGPSLGATSGVRLGGAAVKGDGTWTPSADTTLAASADGVRVHVPAASAALLTIPAGSSPPYR
jgi:hypothetical protein